MPEPLALPSLDESTSFLAEDEVQCLLDFGRDFLGLPDAQGSPAPSGNTDGAHTQVTS